MSARILVGDCREALRGLPDAAFDACVTDPPYHLTARKKGGCGQKSVNLNTPHGRARIGTGFMGMKWDGGDVAMDPATWAEVFRVLKPGAHLLAFGGTRTFHRIACAIEDAGFELIDCALWLYGTGFPKSKNLTGDHAGKGTALKPAWEPCIVARRPIAERNVQANVERYGTGCLNIEECRIAIGGGTRPKRESFSGPAKNVFGDGLSGCRAAGETSVGRWPANVLHDGSDAIVAGFPRDAGAAAPVTRRNADKTRNTYGAFAGNVDEDGSTFHGDSGSAARFFYCAKPSRAERNAGLEGFPEKVLNWSSGEQSPGTFQSPGTNRMAENHHPTVKPVALMQWLVRLVTPTGGHVLDPFAGSGSTGIGALQEGCAFTGIEQDAEYARIAEARLRGVTFGLPLARPRPQRG